MKNYEITFNGGPLDGNSIFVNQVPLYFYSPVAMFPKYMTNESPVYEKPKRHVYKRTSLLHTYQYVGIE